MLISILLFPSCHEGLAWKERKNYLEATLGLGEGPDEPQELQGK